MVNDILCVNTRGRFLASGMSDFREWKLCLVGEMGVGKSSILNRFKDKAFCNGLTTIGTSHATMKLTVDGITHKLLMWDTAGQERFRSLAPLYYRGIRAAILVFSVVDMRSYTSIIDHWIPSIQAHATKEGNDVIIFIVGNKTDLLPDVARAVTREEAESLAEETGCIYFETSAKTGDNVDKLFVELARQVTSPTSTMPTTDRQLTSPRTTVDVTNVTINNERSQPGGQVPCCYT